MATLFWPGCNEPNDIILPHTYRLDCRQNVCVCHGRAPPNVRASDGSESPNVCACHGWAPPNVCAAHGSESPIMHANTARQCGMLRAYLRFSNNKYQAHLKTTMAILTFPLSRLGGSCNCGTCTCTGTEERKVRLSSLFSGTRE